MRINEILTEAVKQRLDPKCWKGKKIGTPKTKVKSGVRVNNCVPAESIELGEEFDLIESIIEDLALHNGVDSEVIWEDLESLDDDELYVFATTTPMMESQGVAEDLKEGVERNYLWHGSTQKIPVLTPRQAHDTGGAPGSNQNAIYATADKNTAIKMGMAERGSDTAMFDQADQLVLFSGRLRRGKNVYLHQLPRYNANGQDMWLPGGNGNEFYTKPEVKELKPLRIIPTPVDSHLSLVRKPTAKDLKLQKKFLSIR